MDVRVVREEARWQLWVETQDKNGNVKRFAGDEPEAENIFKNLTWTNSMPGGHEQMQCVLSRDAFTTYADENLFDQAKAAGHGNRSAFEGRYQRFPKDSGERTTNFNAVGNSVMLRDHTGVRELYVDIDLTHWQGVSVQRRLNLISASYTPADPSVQPDEATGQPALGLAFTGAWSTSGKPNSEAWYDAGPGINIGSIYYAWKKGSNINAANASWEWYVYAAFNDVAGVSLDSSGNLRATGPGTGTLTTTNNNKRYGLVQFLFSTAPDGGNNTSYTLDFTRLAVYGTHGLTKQGTESATSSKGFYGSDIIHNLVTRFAPKLKCSLGAEGSIQPVTFIVPHYVIGRDGPATVEQGVAEINQYYQNDWGVWDDFDFFWAPPGVYKSKTWKVRQDEGAVLSDEGQQADDRYNGVIVKYNDPTGVARTVGPPGSLTDYQDSTLADTDPDNPVNAHADTIGGVRWGLLEMSTVTERDGAILAGGEWLAKTNELKHSGSIKVFHSAEDENGIRCPAYEIRSGDYIQIVDGDNIVRRITKVSGSDEDQSVQCDCDVPPHRLDGLLERMALVLVGVYQQ